MPINYKVIAARVAPDLPLEQLEVGMKALGAVWVQQASDEEAARLDALDQENDTRKNWPYGFTIKGGR